jgi:hypothetical protein
VKRTVRKDATISLDGQLYETDMFLAGVKLTVKYDPDNETGIKELYLYRDDESVGTARVVNYIDNANRKRLGSVKRMKLDAPKDGARFDNNEPTKINTISYAGLRHIVGGDV